MSGKQDYATKNENLTCHANSRFAERGSSMKIAVAGGGTAGHVNIGLEILRANRERGGRGIYLGGDSGFESRLVPRAGEQLEIIPAKPFALRSMGRKLEAVATIAASVRASRRVLLRERVDLVAGTGSYVSLGPCLAARTLGIPVVLHEANALPGLANRLLAPLAQRICVGFAESAEWMRGRVTVYTGNPARWKAACVNRSGGRHSFLVLGGSEGSPFLNARTPELLAELKSLGLPFGVRHLTGICDPEPVRRAYAERGVEAEVSAFTNDLRAAYDEATFVISCAGAVTMAELASAGLPALLTPLGRSADNHQEANARLCAGRTELPWTTEARWNAAELARTLHQILTAGERLEALGWNIHSEATRRAAEAFIAVCEAALQETIDRRSAVRLPRVATPARWRESADIDLYGTWAKK